MKEESDLKWSERIIVCCGLVLFLVALGGVLEVPPSLAESEKVQAVTNTALARAKVFLQAGDYRRAVEACQRNIDQDPSVEAYTYLAYVYQAIDGYLAFFAKKEDYVKVEQTISQPYCTRGH